MTARRRCSYCRYADHIDGWLADGRARCPKRRRSMARWDRERERERRESGVPDGPCAICKQGEKQIRLVYADGSTQWACRSCAELMRSLSTIATGRRPEYEPLPKMRVVAAR